jgi:DNA polymerase elongation subunit (family B)
VAANDNPRILILDIETKLLDLRAFGIRDQFIAHTQIRDIPASARLIHCIGLKWLGERKVTVLTEWEHGYSGMIRGCRDMLDEADAVVGFNHENFDMRKLNGQFAIEGIALPKPPTNIDIFKTARKMGFPSSKLDYLSQAFGIGSKVKHPGFEMWDKVLDGCDKARAKMARYCAGDVRLTEQLYNRLLPYLDNYPHLRERSGHVCPKCTGAMTSQGWKRTKHYKIQSLKCSACGSWGQGRREKVA